MRRVVSGVVLVSLLLAGCGSGKKDTAGPGNDKSTTTTSTTAAPSTTAPTTPPSNTPNATGSGKGATAPTTAKPAAGSGAGSAGAASSAPSSDPGAPKPAAPGTYVYNRTGKANTSAFGDQTLDGQVSLKVDAPNGSDQHSTQTAAEGGREQVLRFLGEGAYFVDIKQSQQGFTKEFQPNPPVLAMPSTPTIGRTWSWTVTSTDDATTLNASFKIERNETLAIGGEQVPTVVVSAVLKLSGDITATSNTTNWVSTAKALIVRADENTNGNVGTVTFTSQSSSVLQSTKPS
jgi:hypothetical protein